MAGRRDKQIDKTLFEKALARAIELDSERGDTLSEHDLVSAGAELGIDERTVRAALREVEGPDARAEPPAGTTIGLESAADALQLLVPPRGLDARSTRMVVASLVWFALFVGFSVGVKNGSVLFSLCLWLAGVWTLVRAIRSAWHREELRLTKSEGQLVFSVGPVSRSQVLDPKRLACTALATHLVLTDGDEHTKIMNGRTSEELRWVAAEVTGWLRDNAR